MKTALRFRVFLDSAFPRVLSAIITVASLAALWVPLKGQWAGGPTGPVYYSGGNVGIGTASPSAQLHVVIPTSGEVGLVVQQAPSQSTDMQEWLSSTGSVIARLDQDGSMGGYQYFNMWDTGSRLFFPAAGIVGIMTGGSERMRINSDGNVGIGTTNPQNALSVNGTIQAKEVLVNAGWSDFVFAPGYQLLSLAEVETYIEDHHHLPDIPSEAEVEEKGVSLGEMQSKLLAKVEELTLHLIEGERRSKELENQNRLLQRRLEKLESRNEQPKNANLSSVQRATRSPEAKP